jgi:transcriptional regulator NrdR family protein
MKSSYVEVRIVLMDLNYPLTKQNLIQQALKHGASGSVMEDLKSIPDREYISSISVFREFEGIKLKVNK